MKATDSRDRERMSRQSTCYKGDGYPHIMMLVNEDTKKLICKASANGTARIDEISHYTNIFAIGCNLAIVEPALLPEEEWNCICEVFHSYVDMQFKMLLVNPSQYQAKMPRRNLVRPPAELTVESLREQMIASARKPSGNNVGDKKGRQIVRLMYMLRCLDHSTLKLRDVAEHFGVSLRTVQRDMEVLDCADYITEYGDEPGTFRFPPTYKSFCATCDKQPLSLLSDAKKEAGDAS